MCLHCGRTSFLHLRPRDVAVLRGMQAGQWDKAIARDMKVGLGTLKAYKTHLFATIGVSTRLEAARWADAHPQVFTLESNRAKVVILNTKERHG